MSVRSSAAISGAPDLAAFLQIPILTAPSAMSTVHPLSVITAVVSQCRTDLNGAASGAVAELVERLARQRLTELHAHPEQLIHGGGASPTVRLLRTGHEGSCHGEPRQRGHR